MERLTHNARRAVQALRCFEGGPRLLGDLLRPGTHPKVRFSVPGGPTIDCPNRPGARVPVFELFADDSYRLQTLTRGLPDELSVLDIGGHIGCFSIALASRSPRARIHAYEASPGTASWFHHNVALNDLGDRVAVHDEAVSDRAGTLQFEDNAGGSSLNRVSATSTATSVSVPCVPLAEAFARCEVPPHLVKIDTEGAEYDMILGTDPTVWSSVRRLVLEYHDVEGHDWPELADHLARGGLRPTGVAVENPRQGVAWLDRVA